MKIVLGLLLIFVCGAVFFSNADYKNRHFYDPDYTEKDIKNFSKQQFILLGLIVLGLVIFVLGIADFFECVNEFLYS